MPSNRGCSRQPHIEASVQQDGSIFCAKVTVLVAGGLIEATAVATATAIDTSKIHISKQPNICSGNSESIRAYVPLTYNTTICRSGLAAPKPTETWIRTPGSEP